MGYQSMPWQQGSSRSFDKLVALSLPALQGKRVLDAGCNTGFFCGWAAFQGAAFVRGVDNNPECVAQAKVWFPGCSFLHLDWANLGPERYDLILCLSAIHYAHDQEALLGMLMDRLTPQGLLVLEFGIAAGDADEFVRVGRRITAETMDYRLFPTWKKAESLLGRYAFKYMGESVNQAGDPAPRHIFHVQRPRPFAALLMDGHYSGKTSAVNALLKPGLLRFMGEQTYHRIADGDITVSPELKAFMRYEGETRHMIPPRITQEICAAGLLPELAAVWAGLAGERDFILEHYIPEEYRLALCEAFDRAGYFVVDIATLAGHKKPWTVKRPPYARYLSYLDHLREISSIDEEAYLAANPDVARAVAEGTMPDATYHYWHFGKREKRPLRV